MLRLDRVAQGEALVDLVVRSAALAGPLNDASFLQLAQDSLDCTLCEANGLRDLPDTNVRIARDADQYMAVITEESPCREALWSWFGIHMTSFT